MISRQTCAILVGLFLFSFITAAPSFTEEAKKQLPKGLPAEDEFVPVDKAPELLKQVAPVYPKEAEDKGITGKVIIRALIDKNGDPIQVKVGKSSGYEMLDESAVAAAKKNKYKPAVKDGKPVAVWVSYTVKFKLDDKQGSKPDRK
jgi:TonB family protein